MDVMNTRLFKLLLDKVGQKADEIMLEALAELDDEEAEDSGDRVDWESQRGISVPVEMDRSKD